MSVLAVVGLSFWAGTIVAGDTDVPYTFSNEPVAVQVSEESIGQSLTLTTLVERDSKPLAVNLLTGIVTVVANDGVVEQGKELYRVGDRQVRAVVGSVPFWRDIYPGLVGDDVK